MVKVKFLEAETPNSLYVAEMNVASRIEGVIASVNGKIGGIPEPEQHSTLDLEFSPVQISGTLAAFDYTTITAARSLKQKAFSDYLIAVFQGDFLLKVLPVFKISDTSASVVINIVMFYLYNNDEFHRIKTEEIQNIEQTFKPVKLPFEVPDPRVNTSLVNNFPKE